MWPNNNVFSIAPITVILQMNDCKPYPRVQFVRTFFTPLMKSWTKVIDYKKPLFYGHVNWVLLLQQHKLTNHKSGRYKMMTMLNGESHECRTIYIPSSFPHTGLFWLKNIIHQITILSVQCPFQYLTVNTLIKFIDQFALSSYFCTWFIYNLQS